MMKEDPCTPFVTKPETSSTSQLWRNPLRDEDKPFFIFRIPFVFSSLIMKSGNSGMKQVVYTIKEGMLLASQ